MSLPPPFKGDRAQAAVLMKDHPFASLISVDDTGLPYVTHLLLHLQEQGEPLVQLSHGRQGQSALALPAGRAAGGGDCYGPHAYMSPKLYPDV